MKSLVKLNYKDEDGFRKLSKKLYDIFDENNDVIIVNIGTDRVIPDSVAPLVGTILKENNFRFPVYGTCDDPIHATNLDKKLQEIKIKHPNATVIALDACLGDDEKDIGEIQLRDYPIRPGKGVGKDLSKVGDYSLIGIVDTSDHAGVFTTANIRLSFILNLSKVIARALIKAEREYYINNKEVAICNF